MIEVCIMTIEQKKLLYEIATWHNEEFYNCMDDHWTTENYKINTECHEAIRRLEKEYKEKYGDLPEWKYINDVWETIKILEKELEI
jgi:hypothetical protein